MRIGEFLVQKGVLTEAQVTRILDHGKKTGLRFGEAGMELDLLSEEKLIRIFGRNYRVDFFHLDPEYFPEDTRSLLPVDEILKWGALPLGSKTTRRFFKKEKIVNIGLLDLDRKKELTQAIERLSQDKSLGAEPIRLKFFLVLADQFIEVLSSVYGIGADELSQSKPKEMDQTLAMFIGGKP